MKGLKMALNSGHQRCQWIFKIVDHTATFKGTIKIKKIYQTLEKVPIKPINLRSFKKCL